MTKFSALLKKPTVAIVCFNPREVHYSLVDYCDNESVLSFRRQDDGTFKVSHSNAFSDLQLKVDAIDLAWLAEDGKWCELGETLDKGVKRVSRVRSR